MHWWNLIKSARLCSQSDFECHAGWSGHNAHIRVALVEDDLNGHTVWLWNRIILPEATILQSVDIQGWSRTGVNNTNIRNIVLIDHRAPKRNTGKRRSRLSTSDWCAGGTGGAWRPSGLHTQEPTLVSPTRALGLHWSIRSWTVATDLHIIHNLPALWINYFYREWTDCELNATRVKCWVCVRDIKLYIET